MTQMFWRFHNFLPFYRVGHNYYLLFVFLFIYSSFPRPSRDHYERLCRVSIPFLRYLFLFCLQREQPSLLPCVFFLKTSFKKDTTPVFLSYLCRYCCFVIVLIVLFLGSFRDFSVGLVSPTTFPFRSQKSIGFSIP